MSDATSEIDRLLRLASKFPALPRAIIGEQDTFDDDQVGPTGDVLRFVTRVTDAPLQASGWLGQDGVWRISRYHIPAAPEHEHLTEDIVAERLGEETLILIDGLAEKMIRYAIPEVLANLTHPEARETFMRRLCASRFAIGVTIH
jgi:hypothetical protein